MKKLYGVTVAMTTPFTESDRVDVSALQEQTNMLIEKGVSCLYPCGTTGEMLRLSTDERMVVAETIVQAAAGRVPVFIHAGCMRQDDTIGLARHAQEIGADGIGVITPQFFGCDPREMEEYFVTVAGSVREDFPVYLYNLPQCSANDLSAQVAQKVAARAKNVIGIKYSFADVNRTMEYLTINDGDFSVLHGCDKVFGSMLVKGCDGTVSGCAGVFPEPFVAVYRAFESGDIKEITRLQKIAACFVNALKAGGNMSYFKEALKLRGLGGGHMRAPQLDIPEPEISALKDELTALCKRYGIEMRVK